ncbi:bifunctional hydroxymethylpyrimidine kinase/phosphomethylpyrimidine kinase [Vibrio albus]|uniref:hydroxymethylpyrimidine kinase n=1 Tax=Vibrio albus TaxID=2200953 RepID=A0A2U3B8Z1_9VIBR|nr:bifunctional hydroxymethylpyrimidine kinase/phosphomethylpyrimidine kinase [Vibrio albus]PWI33241.1 bifunctional hydroxymethylpyrimidine kinase/phosphomethylpyrimidine kinase [Vibrio albus]
MPDVIQPSHSLSSAVPIVLTIAGSDSSGGAGIQADIKAISATGSYACSVITAITSQNTLGVSGVFPIPPEHVEKQLEAVFSDLNVAAVKVGMLADSDIIQTVAKKIRQYQPQFVVVDPVMVATSGDPLLAESAVHALKSDLLPLADLITPNLPEGAALTGLPVPENSADMSSMVSELRQTGAKAVLLKGGHLEQDENSNDLLIFPGHTELLTAKRIHSDNTHGTGCTLSSAIASYLAQGHNLLEAVTLSKAYISQAIAHADQLDIGKGHGPVHHFFHSDGVHHPSN